MRHDAIRKAKRRHRLTALDQRFTADQLIDAPVVNEAPAVGGDFAGRRPAGLRAFDHDDALARAVHFTPIGMEFEHVVAGKRDILAILGPRSEYKRTARRGQVIGRASNNAHGEFVAAFARVQEGQRIHVALRWIVGRLRQDAVETLASHRFIHVPGAERDIGDAVDGCVEAGQFNSAGIDIRTDHLIGLRGEQKGKRARAATEIEGAVNTAGGPSRLIEDRGGLARSHDRAGVAALVTQVVAEDVQALHGAHVEARLNGPAAPGEYAEPGQRVDNLWTKGRGCFGVIDREIAQQEPQRDGGGLVA